MDTSHLADLLRTGAAAVILTDTIYGIIARARDSKAVARLYRLRRETSKKPFIILIDRVEALHEFGIHPTLEQKAFLAKVWPGKVSVVFPCKAKKFAYLHLGTKTLAFRVPKSKRLHVLLEKTGPLVAPSANPEGKKPAETIAQAKRYFGAALDAYAGGGKKMAGTPSTLVSCLGDKPIVLREGAVKIPAR